MVAKARMWQEVLLVVGLFFFVSAKEKAVPITLTEETWPEMLEGEWLVKFHAPWCPACKSLAETWEKVSGWSEDLSIKVGKVDVTENPGLSGRFLVTALPTIYHVKSGEFRTYKGSRQENDIISYIDEQKWKNVDPIPYMYSPSSPHMGILSGFFKLSMLIREIHNTMTERFGIPTWSSYLIFALSTIVLGLVLGVLVVFCCDLCYPPGSSREYSIDENMDDCDKDSDILDDRPTVGDNNVRRRETSNAAVD